MYIARVTALMPALTMLAVPTIAVGQQRATPPVQWISQTDPRMGAVACQTITSRAAFKPPVGRDGQPLAVPGRATLSGAKVAR